MRQLSDKQRQMNSTAAPTNPSEPDDASLTRIAKYLAHCGIDSRRHCEDLIRQGRVKINGTIITDCAAKVNPQDQVTYDGKLIHPEARQAVIIYHKPMGEISTSSDQFGRATVLDHFRNLPYRVYPIGRLDYDSEGLLLLTNDGELTAKLLHPSGEVEKTYVAHLTQPITDEAMTHLTQGVILDDGKKTAPAKITLINRNKTSSTIKITIHEGHNRQIRKMCQTQNLTVGKLRRVAFGPVKLGELPVGGWRYLSDQEILELKRLVC